MLTKICSLVARYRSAVNVRNVLFWPVWMRFTTEHNANCGKLIKQSFYCDFKSRCKDSNLNKSYCPQGRSFGPDLMQASLKGVKKGGLESPTLAWMCAFVFERQERKASFSFFESLFVNLVLVISPDLHHKSLRCVESWSSSGMALTLAIQHQGDSFMGSISVRDSIWWNIYWMSPKNDLIEVFYNHLVGVCYSLLVHVKFLKNKNLLHHRHSSSLAHYLFSFICGLSLFILYHPFLQVNALWWQSLSQLLMDCYLAN